MTLGQKKITTMMVSIYTIQTLFLKVLSEYFNKILKIAKKMFSDAITWILYILLLIIIILNN